MEGLATLAPVDEFCNGRPLMFAPCAGPTGWVPKCTADAAVNPDPVTNTIFPPANGPLLGLTTVTDGAAVATYVKWSAALVLLTPPGVVTVMSTVAPADPGGLTAKSSVSVD